MPIFEKMFDMVKNADILIKEENVHEKQNVKSSTMIMGDLIYLH